MKHLYIALGLLCRRSAFWVVASRSALIHRPSLQTACVSSTDIVTSESSSHVMM